MENEKKSDFNMNQDKDQIGASAKNRASDLTAADYQQSALLLSRTYKAMKAERENIRKWQDGEKIFTTDDALAELISITPQADDGTGVRVQTSNTSDSTAKIGMLLADGYAGKRQKQIMRELFSPEMVEHIGYLDWKIGIVETAMAERMTKLQREIYRKFFHHGFSYTQIVNTHKGRRKLNDRKICLEKDKAVEAVAKELRNEFYSGEHQDYIAQLIMDGRKETITDFGTESRRS